MGDVVYPGIHLVRVHETITEAEVFEAIVTFFGLDESLYRNGRPEVRMYRFPGSPSNVIVSGINLPFNEIRRKLALRKIKQSHVQIRDVDFGIPRRQNAQFEERNLLLHNHLSEGQGRMTPINLITPSFCRNQLGAWKYPSQVVTFEANIKGVDLPKLCQPGECLYHLKSRYVASKRNDDHTDLHYVYGIEGLQAILFFNRNIDLHSPRARFITEQTCQYSGNDFVGNAGQLLDVEGLMAEYKYIPFESVRDDVISAVRIKEMFRTKCLNCKCDFRLLGFSPDFSYFAADCPICSFSASFGVWEGEKFIRLIANPQLSRKRMKYEQVTDYRAKLVPFIKGLTPLFENVDAFARSALAAAYAEYKQGKIDLAANKQFASLDSMEYVEYQKKSGKKKAATLYRALFHTLRSAIWNENNIGEIKKLTIIPPANPNSTDLSEVNYGLSNTWCKGILYDIRSCPRNRQNVIVVAIVKIGADNRLTRSRRYILQPKPTSTTKNSLRWLTRSWRLFEMKRKFQMRTGFIHAAINLGNVFPNGSVEPLTFWTMLMETEADLEISCHEAGDTIMYEAAELFLDVVQVEDRKKVVIQTTGRIYSISKNGDKFVYKFCLMLYAKWRISLNSFVQFRLWVLRENVAIKKANPGLPAGIEFEEEDEEGSEDEQSESDSDDEEMTEANLLGTLNNVSFEKVSNYHAGNHPIPNMAMRSINDVVVNWVERPDTDYSLLDFLLHRKERYILHSKELNRTIKKFPSYVEVNRIESLMNEMQRKSINSTVANRFTTVVGPPGCGKSTTASLMVMRLVLEEVGIILVCAPSNYAAQGLYDKIKEMSRKHVEEMEKAGYKNVTRINVISMLSESRESLDMREEPDLALKDQNLLHVRLRQDEEWRDAENAEIVQVYETDGLGYMKRSDRYDLRNLKSGISRRKLLDADVIVCTVGCGGDHRLESIIWKLRSQGKMFSALIIDEASLLTIPESLPLFTLNPSRVCLLGDGSQLSPVIRNVSALHACLDVSLMEFGELTPYVQENGSEVFNTLVIQYRMANEIASVVSEFMYEGRVISSDSVRSRDYATMPAYELLRRDFPELANHNLGMYGYHGDKEQREDNSNSIWNPEEVRLTVRLLTMLGGCQVPLDRLVIISMYEAQVRRLRMAIASMDEEYQGILVATCDSFQGKEEKIVILNLVRSNPQNDVGFLRNIRRLNVAISRAIDYLMIVGNIEMIKASNVGPLVKLFNIIERKGVAETYL